MSPSTSSQPRIVDALQRYWHDLAARDGVFRATRQVLVAFWEFLRDSTPSRRKSRFGDADYDWDFRVNTTSGAVAWRDRLLGAFHSPYQPTEPALFHEMMNVLQKQVSLVEFTFLDLGSGKGRTLLMATDYPFRKIVGVELLPALHETAQENIARYQSESKKCLAIESICADATAFRLPDGPVVVYLFNPFPESGLRRMLSNALESLRLNSRPMFVIYHNPQLERLFGDDPAWQKIAGTHQYSIFQRPWC